MNHDGANFTQLNQIEKNYNLKSYNFYPTLKKIESNERPQDGKLLKLLIVVMVNNINNGRKEKYK